MGNLRLYLFGVFLVGLPAVVFAQKSTYLGINLASLATQSAEVRSEFQISRILSLQAATGFRFQQRDPGQKTFFQGLNPYIQQKNNALFFSGGMRIYEAVSGRYDYPFFAAEASLIYFSDEFLSTDASGSRVVVRSEGWRTSFTGAMGFVIRLGARTDLDLALQMGYAPPRRDLLSYYFPGTGYSTFGYAVVGFRGGHIQPQITLKYQIVRSRRDRIRDME